MTDPIPVLERVRRRACTSCGDEIFPGEWIDARTGRCEHCVGRVASPGAWTFALAVIVVALVVVGIVNAQTIPPRAAASSSPVVEIAGPLEVIRGDATHYCLPGQAGTSRCTIGYGPTDLVAAIDRDLGIPKGATVIVESLAGDGWVEVRIVDVCGCPGERLIDLTSKAFVLAAGGDWGDPDSRRRALGIGVLPVSLEVVDGPRPRVTLPPTETLP